VWSTAPIMGDMVRLPRATGVLTKVQPCLRQGFDHILDVENQLAEEFGRERYAWLCQALVRITTFLENPTESS
jgi:hypothetical protein